MLSLLKRLRAGTLSKYTRTTARKCTDIVTLFPSLRFLPPFVRSFTRSPSLVDPFATRDSPFTSFVRTYICHARSSLPPFLPPSLSFLLSCRARYEYARAIVPDGQRTDHIADEIIAGDYLVLLHAYNQVAVTRTGLKGLFH